MVEGELFFFWKGTEEKNSELPSCHQLPSMLGKVNFLSCTSLD